MKTSQEVFRILRELFTALQLGADVNDITEDFYNKLRKLDIDLDTATVVSDAVESILNIVKTQENAD
jgi:hypothetical protein